VSNWVGLEDEPGAHPDYNLVQAGIEEECYGQSVCSNGVQYYEWYQFGANSQLVRCNSAYLGPNDRIYVEVTNEAAYGNPNYKYDIYIADQTLGVYCVLTKNYTSMTSPLSSDFITENTFDCGPVNCASLAKFSSVKFSSSQICAGYPCSPIGIYSLYNDGDAMKDVLQTGLMSGSQCTNIATRIGAGTIGSGNGFTNSWDSSEYTPAWNSPDCSP
jgi:hypothetical protein